MSEENVELARRIHGAWNDRDLETMIALADPEVEYVNSPTAVEPGTRHGYDGLTIVLQTQWEMLTGARLEIERTYDRGEEVIVLSMLSRQMPGSEDRKRGSRSPPSRRPVRVCFHADQPSITEPVGEDEKQ
jgi:ketosteroid isomerase-like protein